MKTFKGTAEITDEGVKKHFKNYEPSNAIFEFIWNGFDANASYVSINTNFNNLDGLESVEVLDDGEGIDIGGLKNSFEKFNESSKKNDNDKHGSHGKGRLAFHRLCTSASWYTKRNGYDAIIDIKESAIREYQGTYLDAGQQHALLENLKTGTCVVLKNFISNSLPVDDELIQKISKEFGWYLALNADRSIKLNGKTVCIPPHELHEKMVSISGHNFTVKVIRWDDKPSSEKSYNYLIANKNKVVTKELSKANNKVSFHTSAYAFSDWLDGFNPDELELDIRHAESRRLVREIYRDMTEFQREVYKEYLRRFVDLEIKRFDEEGYFPSYHGLEREYAEWRKENTKNLVRALYLADPQIFNRLNAKPAKILIRLLDKVLVSNENDTIFDVLEGVLDLSSESVDKLATQLKATTLDNVISTIESLQRRQQVIHMLKEVMSYRSTEILETPDLQKIIENNTWLFGPQYATLGAEEDTFTSIARNLRSQIKDVDMVSIEDIENEANIEGVSRQVDLFLARKIPAFDAGGNQIFKCVIVEIKRPSVSLNKKHLQQVDDYCEIISKHPAFGSAKMKFEVVLIGRKISKDDYQIKQRINNLKDKAEFGLVTYNEKIKCFVKDWFTIFDEFELSNNYLLSTLKSKLDALTEQKTAGIILDLQTKNPELA